MKTTTRKTTTKASKRVHTPDSLVDSLVERMNSPEVFDDMREHENYLAVVGTPFDAEIRRLEGVIRAALSDDNARRALNRYADVKNERGFHESEVAFQLGRAWERRIGGSR